MHQMKATSFVIGLIGAMLLGGSSSAQAQAAPQSRFIAEFGIGWDNSISGNINSSAVGRLDNTAVVIVRNKYDDVYNQRLDIRFGGGYMLRDDLEARATFTFQSADADLVRIGDYGASSLYGQYSDYQTFGVDFGLRKYHTVSPSLRAYGEGTIGIGFIDKTDVTLVAPAANLFRNANDFYDQTAAAAFAANAGLLFRTGVRTGIFAQVGLRWVSGMSEVDDLQITGLETVNDDSARWTLPFLIGVRVRF
jgi:hypothetical protein